MDDSSNWLLLENVQFKSPYYGARYVPCIQHNRSHIIQLFPAWNIVTIGWVNVAVYRVVTSETVFTFDHLLDER